MSKHWRCRIGWHKWTDWHQSRFLGVHVKFCRCCENEELRYTKDDQFGSVFRIGERAPQEDFQNHRMEGWK